MAFEDTANPGSTKYGTSSGGFLDLTSSAGVLPTDLPSWSTNPSAAFTIVVIQSLKTQTADWKANYLVAGLSCNTSGLSFGTRESYMSGPWAWQRAFHTTKPVPVEPGWTLHAFVRRLGGTEGAYYYAGASGGIALREAFKDQARIAIGPDRLTVGTSTCSRTANSRTLLGAVLVYNRALSVTDLKRIHEAYAPRFGWSRGGPSTPVCLPGIQMKGNPLSATAVPLALAPNPAACRTACTNNATCEFSVFNAGAGPCWLRRSAISGTTGTNAASANATTCFSRPNYGNYYCIRNWDVKGSSYRTYTPMDKSTCLGECDRDPTCQFAFMASNTRACVLKRAIFTGANGTTQYVAPTAGSSVETCVKARVQPNPTECGKWTKGAPGETRVQKDCDGDGILDAVLFDTSGARGVALSTRGCSTADADTGYPSAPDAACPAVLRSLCPRPPAGWCPSGRVLQLDCDADGVKDLACIPTDDRSANKVVRSGLGCVPGAADSFCPPLTANGSCPYPAGQPCGTARLLSVDCNNDRVRDWVCLGDGGQRGVIRSAACNTSAAVSGWPTAPDRACPILFGMGALRPAPPPPKPPSPPNPPPSPRPPSPPPVCVSYPGYRYQAGVVHAGDDLVKVASAAEARTACSRRQDCAGFTGQGWLKSKVAGTTPGNASLCLYTKIPTTCPYANGYYSYGDMAHASDTLRTYPSLAAAAAACAADAACLGYSGTAAGGQTKSWPLPAVYSHPNCLYAKVTPCPEVLETWGLYNYEAMADLDQPDNNIKQVIHPNATFPLTSTFLACEDDPYCSGFNSKGWLKKDFLSPVFSYGSCLYTRVPNEQCQDIDSSSGFYTVTPSVALVGKPYGHGWNQWMGVDDCNEWNRCSSLVCTNPTASSEWLTLCDLYEDVEVDRSYKIYKHDSCFYNKIPW
ncbi:hypothetical protein HYH03_015852 [Edaphochlamys debaryana]|uniref:Uncharacterized protein n=1 Tax=Edaphochlamys debaryana TaxID=47281 RepID=A0A835XSU1_9CHLO|nr:hypothetical protein HYH03_015852 [Edaphochlamys debaryana]|eukprot:KAG2485359.1 hypothetical protein HYH03_015852 [Edaphochlamys debaryana]